MENETAVSDYQADRNVIPFPDKLGVKEPPGPPLQPPGGGGTFDGMEPRVARLEADVAHIKTDVADLKSAVRTMTTDVTAIKVDLARLAERVGNLPTKGYIGWWITGGVAASIGVLTLLSKLGILVAGAPK